MAVFEIFSHPESRRYKTHICSLATFVQLFCVLLTFIPPLLISYRSQGFWIRQESYREQGDVHFKHQVVLVLDLAGSGYLAWSTMQNFNQLQMSNLRVPIIKSWEEDVNRDGKNDQLHFDMDVPLVDTEQVTGFKLLLFFDYKLYKMSSLRMESMAYVHHSSVLPGALYSTVGDLKLRLRQPLAHIGLDTRYNSSIIDSTSVYAETYDLPTIFKSYSSRNVTTVFADDYPVWTSGRGAGQPFKIRALVRYPEELVIYRPGFWEVIKWGWIQYLAVLLVFLFVLDRIKVFIFQHQLVPTIIERPFHAKTQ